MTAIPRPACAIARSVAAFLAISLNLAVPSAHAHGPDLGIVGIVTGDVAAPGIVRLTRGLAVSRGTVLEFICPERWGGPDFPAIVAGESSVVVAGLRGPFVVKANGDVSALGASEALGLGRTKAVAGDGASVLALTTAGTIWQVSPGAPYQLATLAERPDALISTGVGTWVLAGEDNGVLRLSRLVPDPGSGLATPFLEAPFRANPGLTFTPGLPGMPGDLWVHGSANDGYRLWRVNISEGGAKLEPIAATSEPIFGPVRGRDGVFVVLGGQPHRIVDDMAMALSESPRLFCIQAMADGALAVCVGTELHHYRSDTGVGERILSLSQLRPPTLAGLEPGQTLGCKAQWEDAARDAALPEDLIRPPEWQPVSAELPPEAVAEPERVEAGGCGSGPTNQTGLASVLTCMLLSRLRRTNRN